MLARTSNDPTRSLLVRELFTMDDKPGHPRRVRFAPALSTCSIFDDDDELRRGALTMQACISVIPVVGAATYGVIAFRSGHMTAACMALLDIVVVVTGIAITLRLRYASDIRHATCFNAWFVTSLAAAPCVLSLYEVVRAENPMEVGRYRADAIEGAIMNVALTHVVLGVIFGTLEFTPPRRRFVVMGSLNALHLSASSCLFAVYGDGRWLVLVITSQVVPVVLGHALVFSIWRYVIQPYRDRCRQLSAKIELTQELVEQHRETIEQHDATLSSLRRDPALVSLLHEKGDTSASSPPSVRSGDVPSGGEDSPDDRERETTSVSSKQSSLREYLATETNVVQMAADIVGLDAGVRHRPTSRRELNDCSRRVL